MPCEAAAGVGGERGLPGCHGVCGPGQSQLARPQPPPGLDPAHPHADDRQHPLAVQSPGTPTNPCTPQCPKRGSLVRWTYPHDDSGHGKTGVCADTLNLGGWEGHWIDYVQDWSQSSAQMTMMV